MTFLVTDIETIPDERLRLPEPRKCTGGAAKAGAEHEFLSPQNVCLTCGAPPEPFLAPPYHRIVALGYALLSDDYEIVSMDVMNAWDDEEKALRDFTEYLEASPRTTLVTFNGRSFDAPVIAARCFAKGVPFPWYYRSKARFRYDTGGHLDLMDTLADFGAAPRTRMEAYAQAMGLPGKVGTDGSMVTAMVAGGRLADVLAYCACDVAQETALFLRLQFLRTVLTLEAYQWAMVGLCRRVLDSESLSALRKAGIDWHRALLSREEL